MNATMAASMSGAVMLALFVLGCDGGLNDKHPAGQEQRQSTSQPEITSRLSYTFVADTESTFTYGEHRFSRIVLNPPQGAPNYRLQLDEKGLAACDLQSLLIESGNTVIPLSTPCRVFPGLAVATRDCGALKIVMRNGVYELHGTTMQQRQIDKLVSGKKP